MSIKALLPVRPADCPALVFATLGKGEVGDEEARRFLLLTSWASGDVGVRGELDESAEVFDSPTRS